MIQTTVQRPASTQHKHESRYHESPHPKFQRSGRSKISDLLVKPLPDICPALLAIKLVTTFHALNGTPLRHRPPTKYIVSRYIVTRERFPSKCQEPITQTRVMALPVLSRSRPSFRGRRQPSEEHSRSLPFAVIVQAFSLYCLPSQRRESWCVRHFPDVVVLSHQHIACRANKDIVTQRFYHAERIISIYASTPSIIVDEIVNDGGHGPALGFARKLESISGSESGIRVYVRSYGSGSDEFGQDIRGSRFQRQGAVFVRNAQE